MQRVSRDDQRTLGFEQQCCSLQGQGRPLWKTTKAFDLATARNRILRFFLLTHSVFPILNGVCIMQTYSFIRFNNTYPKHAKHIAICVSTSV